MGICMKKVSVNRYRYLYEANSKNQYQYWGYGGYRYRYISMILIFLGNISEESERIGNIPNMGNIPIYR